MALENHKTVPPHESDDAPQKQSHGSHTPHIRRVASSRVLDLSNAALESAYIDFGDGNHVSASADDVFLARFLP